MNAGTPSDANVKLDIKKKNVKLILKTKSLARCSWLDGSELEMKRRMKYRKAQKNMTQEIENRLKRQKKRWKKKHVKLNLITLPVFRSGYNLTKMFYSERPSMEGEKRRSKTNKMK